MHLKCTSSFIEQQQHNNNKEEEKKNKLEISMGGKRREERFKSNLCDTMKLARR